MGILKRKIDLNQESEPFSLKKGCDLLTKCKKYISLHCDEPGMALDTIQFDRVFSY